MKAAFTGGYPLAADEPRLYLFTRFFLILLRLAIGWHFLYEGYAKWQTYQEGYAGPPWTAEGYLHSASGPVAPLYRKYLLDDPGGLGKLVEGGADFQNLDAHIVPALEEEWKAHLERFAQHYQLNDEQKQKALGKLDAAKKKATDWLKSKDNAQYVSNYLQAVQRYRQRELEFSSLPDFEQERFVTVERRGLQEQRAYIVGQVYRWTAEFHASLLSEDEKNAKGEKDPVLTPEQRAKGEPKFSLKDYDGTVNYLSGWSRIDWIDRVTVYGLMVIGALLILGLFTRLASLGAAVFLAGLYLAMPPWPGLPGTSVFGGHYLFINFHVIEGLAVLAAAASGRWFGVGAFLRALFGRKPAPPKQAKPA